MSKTIRIDDEVYESLQARAIPFQDTPNSVLRGLLGLSLDHSEIESVSEGTETATQTAGAATKRPSQAKRSGKRKRAPKGSLLPESEYELPILRILEEAGGSAPASEVIGKLGEVLDPKLQEIDRATVKSGRIRWQSRAQFVRLKLTEKGDLIKGSPRGIWEISPSGRERLKGRGQ